MKYDSTVKEPFTKLCGIFNLSSMQNGAYKILCKVMDYFS